MCMDARWASYSCSIWNQIWQDWQSKLKFFLVKAKESTFHAYNTISSQNHGHFSANLHPQVYLIKPLLSCCAPEKVSEELKFQLIVTQSHYEQYNSSSGAFQLAHLWTIASYTFRIMAPFLSYLKISLIGSKSLQYPSEWVHIAWLSHATSSYWSSHPMQDPYLIKIPPSTKPNFFRWAIMGPKLILGLAVELVAELAPPEAVGLAQEVVSVLVLA